MIQLIYSNRMDELVDPLIESLHAARLRDPLAPVHVVAPNPTVEQYLRFRVAERLGIAANLKFRALTSFLAQCVTDAQAGVQVLTKDALQLLILGRLQDPSALAHPDLHGVRTYLDVAKTADERALRLYQLSGETARLFEEYGFNRRGMLRLWQHRLVLADTEWADAERWQRHLYTTLFDGAGRARVVDADRRPRGQLDLFSSAQDEVRWMPLLDAVASLSNRLPLPDRIHVFGVSYLAHAFAEVLYRISARTEVSIYALNPCFSFWEDVVSMRHSDVQSRWVRRGERVGGDLEGSDPFNLDGHGDTPALRLWGRPGREFIRLLNEMTDCEFESRFKNTPSDSTLDRLKRDILVRAPERPTIPSDLGAQTRDQSAQYDGSISVIGAPTLRREVEIVADHIWSEIEANAARPEEERLRFHEIAVLVTDAERARYQAHLEAVFRQRHGLPFNMIDRSLAGQSRALEAISRLLDLPTSGFTHEAMIGLLTHPCVGGAVAHDVERWRRWCGELNILFGADASALAETYLDARTHHWDQGLRRLVLGVFLAGDRSGVKAAFESPVGMWLPLETPPDAVGEVARLVGLARRLIADAQACREAVMPVAHWASFFVHLAQTYLVTEDVGDETALSKCTTAFGRLGKSDLTGTPVGFVLARELARQALAGLDRGRGQHQANGVVVSSLQPMRAIPFKRVYVLGLSEGVFPTMTRQEPLDLRRARRRAADVSGTERDRYLFLETLLSTQGKLVLSYVARDPHSGETREPSAVVRELLYILRGYLTPEAVAATVTIHPRHHTDPRYLEHDLPTPKAPTAGPGRAAIALRENIRAHLGGAPPSLIWPVQQLSDDCVAALAPALLWAMPVDPEPAEVLELSIRHLVSFLESPLQGAARFHLRVWRDDDPPQADEPLKLAFWERRDLLTEAMWAGGGHEEETVRAYDALSEMRRLEGGAPVGAFGDQLRRQDLRDLKHWLIGLEPLGTTPLDRWVRVRIGGDLRGGEAQEVWPAMELAVPMANGSLQQVRLSGTLPPLEPDYRRSLRFTTNSEVRERTHIRDFLTLMVLAATDRAPAGHFEAVVTKKAKKTAASAIHRKRFTPPTPAEARRWLATVTADLVAGLHPYRMPAGLALDWGRRVRRGENPVDVERMLSSESLDKNGPIRVPERFPAPTAETLSGLVERRFGPWFDLDLTPPKPRRRGKR